MAEMPSAAQLQAVVLRSEIETLLTECAYCLDRADFTTMLEHYTEDCEVFSPQPPFAEPNWSTIRGKANLTEHYARPPWTSPSRIMRHVVTNIRLRPETENRVKGTVTLIGYRHEGLDISPALPMMVGDYEDVYERGADQRWRIARRKVVIKFLSHELLNQQYPDAWGIGKEQP